MAAYATTSDVQARLTRSLSAAELTVCSNLLDDAAVIIDAYNANAAADAKLTVSCRMAIRALGDGGESYPVGATQGSQSALGYSQSWAVPAGGSVGELYLNRVDKKLLGAGNAIGSYSPAEELTVPQPEVWT